MKEIEYIEVDGHFDLRRIFPWDYSDTRREFSRETPSIILPSWTELYEYGDVNKLWILLSDSLVIKIWYIDDTYDIYTVSRGFVYDKVTIPVVKDNRLVALLANIIHDINFSSHCMSFKDTNELFFQMLRCNKIKYNGQVREHKRMSLIEASIWEFFVGSIGGRIRWKSTNRPLHLERVKITLQK